MFGTEGQFAEDDPRIGAVAIGRNEAQRLPACLMSILRHLANVVYVDSGSTDNSVDLATSLGVEVLRLNPTQPFTAARARNVGFARLLELSPNLEYVQFVDGDCKLVGSWVERATEFLSQHEDVAAVCGRLRELFPKANIYHRLCEMEWNTPIGKAKSCGGIAMFRARALREVGGFNPGVDAGEEPEVCVRLRQANWHIWRIDEEMALHDAQMTRFGQWWSRMARGGRAHAVGASLHGAPPVRHGVAESRSIWLWGVVIPILALSMAKATTGLSLVFVLVLYVLLATRITMTYNRCRGFAFRDAVLFAIHCVAAKVPQAWGQVRFLAERLVGGRANALGKQWSFASDEPGVNHSD